MDLDVLFNDMADLERKNYVQMFAEMGRIYDKEFSINMFKEDHPKGGGIIYFYTGSALTAFLRFVERSKKIRICSLQLKKGHENQLRNIIRSTYQLFSNIDFEVIESEVWKSNNASLILHIKLNFQYRRMNKHKVVFIIKKDRFLTSLKDVLG
jgi:L-amino acid N-acyltransferase YncA